MVELLIKQNTEPLAAHNCRYKAHRTKAIKVDWSESEIDIERDENGDGNGQS